LPAWPISLTGSNPLEPALARIIRRKWLISRFWRG
jgi:hypothetical protein